MWVFRCLPRLLNLDLTRCYQFQYRCNCFHWTVIRNSLCHLYSQAVVQKQPTKKQEKERQLRFKRTFFTLRSYCAFVKLDSGQRDLIKRLLLDFHCSFFIRRLTILCIIFYQIRLVVKRGVEWVLTFCKARLSQSTPRKKGCDFTWKWDQSCYW